MATFNITTTADQDAAVLRYVPEFNAAQRLNDPAWVDLTPIQYARRFVLQHLDTLIAMFKDRDRITKAEAYAMASPEDKAAVDAILAKYQAARL